MYQATEFSPMISFVWDDKNPMYSGRGGTENVIAGQIRELTLMGIDARVITINVEEKIGNKFFPDIEFLELDDHSALASLEDTIVFINIPSKVKTRKRSFVFFHSPPSDQPELKNVYQEKYSDKSLIVASHFAQKSASQYLSVPENEISVVYPFADENFGEMQRPKQTSEKPSIIFAGRLDPEKGIFLFLEMIHQLTMKDDFLFTATNAGNQGDEGPAIEKMLIANPYVTVVPSLNTPKEMAELLVQHQILVMPSSSFYWHEAFGMLSVEAQHAGCYVVATDDGGLPETDCGGLTLFEPGNALSFAQTIQKVAQLPPVEYEERAMRAKRFTRRESVMQLLDVLEIQR